LSLVARRAIGSANTKLGVEKRVDGNVASVMALGPRIGPLAEVAVDAF
jgi:hypothetical protein